MIAALIGMGMSMLGSSGIFDKEYTQTNVDYSKFGNFKQAGRLPGVVSGQTEVESEEIITNTGISDMLQLGGGTLGTVAPAMQGIGEALEASGAKAPGAAKRAARRTSKTT